MSERPFFRYDPFFHLRNPRPDPAGLIVEKFIGSKWVRMAIYQGPLERAAQHAENAYSGWLRIQDPELKNGERTVWERLGASHEMEETLAYGT